MTVMDARARTRIALRRELSGAAFDYLAGRDFESVTVEDLAAAIGVSRATFFRHFASKEDIVLETATPSEHDFAAVVSALTEEDRLDPLGAVIEVLRRSLPPVEEQTDRLRARVRMITTTPSLGARLAVRRGARQEELTAAVRAWLNDPERAQVCAAVGFACLDVAWRRWAGEPSQATLGLHFDDVVAAMAHLAERGTGASKNSGARRPGETGSKVLVRPS